MQPPRPPRSARPQAAPTSAERPQSPPPLAEQQRAPPRHRQDLRARATCPPPMPPRDRRVGSIWAGRVAAAPLGAHPRGRPSTRTLATTPYFPVISGGADLHRLWISHARTVIGRPVE